jgi:hypothetical protein
MVCANAPEESIATAITISAAMNGLKKVFTLSSFQF